MRPDFVSSGLLGYKAFLQRRLRLLVKMRASTFTSALFFVAAKLVAGLDSSSLTTYKDSLALDSTFGPIIEAYWTGYPHHRRTPFAVSPDGASAYLAYLDSSGTGVHVQKVKPDTFVADGAAITISGGKEAGGLVAHNDGFALLTNEALPSGTSNAPAGSTPVPVIYRYTGSAQTWKTFVAGPSVTSAMGLLASPDMNGDLVYSETAKMYGAYFVVTAYSGSASGHFGDAIQYVSDAGKLQTITGASSTWGCSHNTGILFEAADAAPFASVCAEDQGDIWLNTKTQSMSGVKVSNENTTNGASGEPFGGMSGSYSGLARFQGADSYIMAWVSNGAVDLTANTWMGDGYTSCSRRNKNRNVAIATFSDKNTLVGEQASSVVGAADGDSQINWLTTGTSDMSNARIATFDKSSALVSWEEASSPNCDSFIAMGCYGTYAGTSFQVVDSTGAKSGAVLTTKDVQVAGDMVTMSDGRICWPYVSMTWSLAQMATTSATTKAISFACISNGASINTSTTAASSSSVVVTSAVSSSAAVSVSPIVKAPSTPSSSAAPTTLAAAEAASTPAASSSAAPIEFASTPAAMSSGAPAVVSSSFSRKSSKTMKSKTVKSKGSKPQFPTMAAAGSGDGAWPTGSFPTGSGYFTSGIFPSGFISPTGTPSDDSVDCSGENEDVSSIPTSAIASPLVSSIPSASAITSANAAATTGADERVPDCDEDETTSTSASTPAVIVKAHASSEGLASSALPSSFSFPTGGWAVPSSAWLYPTVASSGFGGFKAAVTAGTASPSKLKQHGKTSKHSKTSKSKTPKTKTAGVAQPTGHVVRRFEQHGQAHGTEHFSGSLPTGFVRPTGFNWKGKAVGTAGASKSKHHKNTGKHNAHGTGAFPTASLPTGSFSHQTGDVVRRATEPKKYHGNTRKHSSAFPTGIFPTGSFPTGHSFPTASGVSPTGSSPTGSSSISDAKNKIAIGLALSVTKPKTKVNERRKEHRTLPHGTGVARGTGAPHYPKGTGHPAFPTGVARPTGFRTETRSGHGHPNGTGYHGKPKGTGGALPTGFAPTGKPSSSM
ncbi:hypothetical protein FKW77_010407 [Venturia effusa]|uniref:Uncharacterized protein n=1 Tax=Venturia effusa TaxID=50376 RepID=A0A517L2E8_9PEZI|nr:hypothetical protein FKW77_010407 [Venturia effusa]